METIRLNTILYPNKPVRQKACHLATQLATTSDHLLVVDDRKYIPHITLYSPEYPKKNITTVVSSIEQLCKKLPIITLAFDAFATVDDGGLFANFLLNQEVMDVKQKIIQTLNPLRENHIRKKCTDDVTLSDTEKADARQYGYPINK